MSRRGILNEWMGVQYSELSSVAQWVSKNLSYCKIFLLSGSMGSGKTTFVRMYLDLLGVNQFEGSPTFNYYNLYPVHEVQKDLLIVHMDLSRVPEDDIEFQTQFEEFQLMDAILFVENYNPQKGLLLEDYINIFFEEESSGMRKIRIEGKLG